MGNREATAKRLRTMLDKTRDWVQANVPPGLRLLLGLVLIAGGVLGFLPILGFWMIPLGVVVALMDIRPIVRAIAARFGSRD